MADILQEITRLKYQELARALAQANIGQGIVGESAVWQSLNNGNLTATQFNKLVSSNAGYNAGFRAVANADGTVRSYTYIGHDYPMTEFTYDDIIGAFDSNVQSGTSAPSNTFTMQQPTNTALSGAAGAETMKASGGVRKYTNGVASANPVLTTMGSVVGAVMAAGTGIQLAKTIDGGLYHIGNALNLNPPESLNPETWNTITSGDDSAQAGLFNYIFGLNPDNGQLTAYADERAFAYMAGWLYQQGFFASSSDMVKPIEQQYLTYTWEGLPVALLNLPFKEDFGLSGNPDDENMLGIENNTSPVIIGAYTVNNSTQISINFVSENPFTVTKTYKSLVYRDEIDRPLTLRNIPGGGTKDYYRYSYNVTEEAAFSIIPHAKCTNTTSFADARPDFVKTLLYGDIIHSSSIDGVNTQPDGIVPNTSGWDYNDPNNTILPSLQNQYPDLWNNRIENDVVQPDGNVKTYTYIPTQIPSGGNGTNADTQNDRQNTTDPSVNPDDSSDTKLQTIIQILTSLLPQALTDPATVPEEELQDGTNTKNPNPDIPTNNPPGTGTGSSPIPILPTGNASSLWKVYHPSQATIDAFGAWLWSSNFVEQIKKMFNDPMSAIIGLHKVFAPPIDAGTANIKVGYLDSGVASAYVDQQYVTVDCGSITLREYFGNVFDYEPYTKVAIYLPFIGVQSLSTAEVMRSTINVVYHVDIFTGACLAEVNITRDGDTGCLYTFAGDCSARYPLSSGSYMGIVGGVLSIAGGIAGTVATGGNLLPALLGASSAMTHMRTDVKHSGQLSGNAGAMGVKVPFLIVLRPQTAMANSYEHFTGRPANKFALIGEASGYIRCKEVHVDNLSGASDKEKEMVASLLKSGIIV